LLFRIAHLLGVLTPHNLTYIISNSNDVTAQADIITEKPINFSSKLWAYCFSCIHSESRRTPGACEMIGNNAHLHTKPINGLSFLVAHI